MAKRKSGQPQATPGAKMIYLIKRREGATREELLVHWFANHMPLVIKSQHDAAAAGRLHARRYIATFAEFERIVGLANLRGFHLNDSKLPHGSRVDRHAEIGAGYIGSVAFGRLIRDPRFAGMPMVLETPGGQAAYRRGLQRLRRMLRDL